MNSPSTDSNDVKGDLSSLFKRAQANIDKWANIPNFDQTPGGTSRAPIPRSRASTARRAISPFTFSAGAARNSRSSYQPPAPAEAIFKDLLNLLEQEGATLKGAYDAIKADIIDQFNSLSLAEIIKRFAAIVVDTLLQTVENILLAVLDIFIQLIRGMMKLLSATIDIPVMATSSTAKSPATISPSSTSCA